MDRVQDRIEEVLDSSGRAKEVFDYVGLTPGKRLRPSLVLLTFSLCGGTKYDEAINAATGVELVHMASLIHDDIIDRSELRRGQETVHRKFGTQAAVLAGDHLFAAAFHLFSLSASGRVSQLMTSVIQGMCSGEINQLLDPVTNEKEYMAYISKKTASLIGGCCRLGAILSDLDPLEGKQLQEFGENLGLAFQLTDDVLDYRGVDLTMGKQRGRDFAEGVWTMPTIRAYYRGLIPHKWSRLDFQFIRSILETTGILGEVWQVAADYAQRAIRILERFPESTTRTELLNLSQKVLERHS